MYEFVKDSVWKIDRRFNDIANTIPITDIKILALLSNDEICAQILLSILFEHLNSYKNLIIDID